MAVRSTSARWMIAAATGLAMLASACSGGESKGSAAAAPPAQPLQTVAAGPLVTEINLVATDTAFEPAAFSVPVGKEVTLSFSNKGSAPNNVRVAGVQTAAGDEAATPKGALQATISFTITKAGGYTFTSDANPNLKGVITAK